jgi:ribosome-associated protein
VKKTKQSSFAGKRLVDLIISSAEEKLADKITYIDLTGMATPAEYFIICQSDTTVQNRAIADSIIDRCTDNDTRPWHYEGIEDGRWILIDFTDVVVHILLPELRSYYDLESLVAEGKRHEMQQ